MSLSMKIWMSKVIWPLLPFMLTDILQLHVPINDLAKIIIKEGQRSFWDPRNKKNNLLSQWLCKIYEGKMAINCFE